LLFVFLSFLQPCARAAVITGKVLDASSNKPIEGAEITYENNEGKIYRAFAGPGGVYRIEGVKPGNYSSSLSCDGYLSVYLENIAVGGENDVLKRDGKLERIPSVSSEILVTGQLLPALSTGELTAKELAGRGPADIGEILRAVPEVSAIRRGGYGLEPSIRGLSGERVDVVIDGGAKVRGACPSRMDPSTSHFNPSSLREIEVLKGPFSVRYGPVFSGIVNLASSRPEVPREKFGVKGKFSAGYESNAEGKRGDAGFWGGNKRFNFLLGGGIRDFGNYSDGEGVKVDSSYEARDWTSKLGFNVRNDQIIQVSLQGQHVRDALYPALPMDADKDDSLIGYVDYSLQRAKKVLGRLNVKVYGSGVEHRMSNARKATAKTMKAVADVDTAMEGFRVEGFFTLRGTRGMRAGFDMDRLRMDGTRTRDILAGPMAGKHFNDILWPDATKTSFGFFSELELPGAVKGETTVGVRLDRAASDADRPEPGFLALSTAPLEKTNVAVSAFASTSFRPRGGWELNVAAARGVRTPDIRERFVYLLSIGIDRYDYLGNTALKPEVNYQIDLRARKAGARHAVGVTVFTSWLEDFISARVLPGVAPRSPGVLGVKQFVNIPSAFRTGLEVDGSYEIGSGVSLKGVCTWMQGTNRSDDDPLPQIPPATVNLSLTYRHGRGAHLREPWIEIAGRFEARQDRVSSLFAESPTPGFGVVDLRGGFSLKKGISLNFALENLFNNNYYYHLNRMSQLDGRPIPEPGRNFHSLLVWSF
jgi:iron complex outermembrane receptor protein